MNVCPCVGTCRGVARLPGGVSCVAALPEAVAVFERNRAESCRAMRSAADTAQAGGNTGEAVRLNKIAREWEQMDRKAEESTDGSLDQPAPAPAPRARRRSL